MFRVGGRVRVTVRVTVTVTVRVRVSTRVRVRVRGSGGGGLQRQPDRCRRRGDPLEAIEGILLELDDLVRVGRLGGKG